MSTYATQLLIGITSYNPTCVMDCLAKGYYTEAVTEIQIQLTEQMRLLLIQRTKSLNGIPLNNKNPRYKIAKELYQRMDESVVGKFAFINDIISEEQFNQFKELNAIRNKFAHTYRERKKCSDQQINRLFQQLIPFEKELREKCTRVPAYFD
jgi:hypothetical protein